MLAAARALVQSGDLAAVERVLDFALTQNLYTPILLAEDLRRFAMQFCEGTIPGILNSADPRRILPALELLVAWEGALPLPHLAFLMRHADRKIRIQALRLAPLVPLEELEHAAILSALDDADPEIAAVASATAMKIQLFDAVPALAQSVRRGPPDRARAAAAAMAGLPPLGWTELQEIGAVQNLATAGIARDALELARRQEV